MRTYAASDSACTRMQHAAHGSTSLHRLPNARAPCHVPCSPTHAHPVMCHAAHRLTLLHLPSLPSNARKRTHTLAFVAYIHCRNVVFAWRRVICQHMHTHTHTHTHAVLHCIYLFDCVCHVLQRHTEENPGEGAAEDALRDDSQVAWQRDVLDSRRRGRRTDRYGWFVCFKVSLFLACVSTTAHSDSELRIDKLRQFII